jgi:hypothetical protein
MNIQKLLELLSENEKRELLSLLNSERVTISEFIRSCKNDRVKIALKLYLEQYDSIYVDEIIYSRFIRLRNVGKKTWYDFQQLICL